jgi:hypothetical protein
MVWGFDSHFSFLKKIRLLAQSRLAGPSVSQARGEEPAFDKPVPEAPVPLL